jgi:hypothetical protein
VENDNIFVEDNTLSVGTMIKWKAAHPHQIYKSVTLNPTQKEVKVLTCTYYVLISFYMDLD